MAKQPKSSGRKSAEGSSKLPVELANKICDALGLPGSTYYLKITFDWQTRRFDVKHWYYIKDDEAQVILDAINGQQNPEVHAGAAAAP